MLTKNHQQTIKTQKHIPKPKYSSHNCFANIEKVSAQYNSLNTEEKTILTMPTMFTYNLLIQSSFVKTDIPLTASNAKVTPITEAIEIFRKIDE